ncbi:MAG TPA: carboxylate--amine ligase [Firmicutes bacterium]|nr:carboxylate--amine ligase [Bacillota bacterium]
MAAKAVILGANFYTALGAIRTLGRHGVKVYALDYDFSRAYALSSRYVFRKVFCPDINQDEEALADFLLRLGRQFEQPPVLMASADNYALLISRYAEELAPYYLFPDNPPRLLETIINKRGLYRLSQQHGLQMPLTYFPDNEAAIKEAAEGISYPCIVKPSISHRFVKVFRSKCLLVNDTASLIEALKKARAAGLEVMVQEIIPGFDDQMFCFDVYINREGRPTHTLVAQKLRQFPANFGSSTLTHQCYDPEIVELGLEYMRKLGYRGYGEIEFKRHPENGRLYMIEINARLSSLNVLFDLCGVEFTYIMYRDLIGEPLPDYHLREEKPWAFWHAYEDFVTIRQYRRTGQLTWGQIIKPWFTHRKAHAIWAADDPKPLLSFGRIIFRKVVNKVQRLLFQPLQAFFQQRRKAVDKGVG